MDKDKVLKQLLSSGKTLIMPDAFDPISAKIIDELSMLNKIKDANKTKIALGRNEFIINTWTDALLSLDNRKEAQKLVIERANSYLEAGADICFVAFVKTLDEVKLFSKEINGPISIAAGLPYNMQEFSINNCVELGIVRVSLPNIMILNSIGAMVKNLKEIKDTGNFNQAIQDNWLLSNADVLQNIINNKK